MNFLAYSSPRPSTICSSSPVPSVQAGQHLRLAALEQGRAVGAGEQAHLAQQRADGLVVAAVGALAVEDHVADDLLFDHRDGQGHVEGIVEGLLRGRVDGAELGDDAFLDRVNRGAAVVFLALAAHRAEFAGVLAVDGVVERVAGLVEGADLFLADGLAEFLDGRGDVLDDGVAGLDGLEDDILGEFAGADFDHVDGFVGAGEEQVQVGAVEVRLLRLDDEVAIDAGDADGGDRAFKRNRGNVQRGRSADHREHVRIVLAVGREDHDLDEHFVEIAPGEQRTDGTVDHAGGEGFLGGGTPFTLDEAARKLAGGGGGAHGNRR